jgi:DNA polymerase I
METLRFTLLDIDYITRKGKPLVRLFGKLPDGRSIIAHDRNFQPYIYVLPHDIDSCIKELNDLGLTDLEKTAKEDIFQKKNFIKINLNLPKELHDLTPKQEKLDSEKEIREHDISFYRRYLIDKGLFPMNTVEVKGKKLKPSSNGTCLFEIQSGPQNLESCLPEMNILSFSIEATNAQGMPKVDEDPIITVSFCSNQGFHKVYSTKPSTSDFVETISTEKELIEKFVETVKSENPDIISGYNSDKFDFPYIKNRADKLGVSLNLGVDGSNIKFYSGRMKYAYIKGTIHVDLYKIARRYLQLNDHTLERVYFKLYQKEKIDIPFKDIQRCWTGENQKREYLYKYELEDVKSISLIGDKLLTLIIEITRIVGQPLFEITRRGTGTQVKWYLIRKTYEKGHIIPNEFGKFERNIVGGYVDEPKPGLHENIFYFDFRSLYPSIIVAKNISPETLTEDESDDCHVAPEFGYKFRKTPKGFIPSVVSQLLDNRMQIKSLMKKFPDEGEYQMLDYRQDAMKRLSSTVYGLYNHPQFRWYCVKCSEAITAWGKEFLQETMKRAEKKGFKVVYADTDGFYACGRDE